jgi:putative phosphoesterase
MLIAIMSDSHDHIHQIEKALLIAMEKKVDAIIHCGDIVAPFTLKIFGKPKIPFYGVFGNNDGDRIKMIEYSKTILPNVKLYERFGEVLFDDKKIAFTHYYDQAKPLALTGKYNMVCFGHSHTWYCNKVDKTILLNPGEIMGKEGSPGFAIFDTTNNNISEVKI